MDVNALKSLARDLLVAANTSTDGSGLHRLNQRAAALGLSLDGWDGEPALSGDDEGSLFARHYRDPVAGMGVEAHGFTWEDVDLLTTEADVLAMVTLPLLESRGDAEHCARVEAKAGGLRGLAARIAALLPPRER